MKVRDSASLLAEQVGFCLQQHPLPG